MSETSEATVWIARDSDGDFVIATGKAKPVNAAKIPRQTRWRQPWGRFRLIYMCQEQMRTLFPVLRSMRPGAKPRRLKITMEFEEE